MEPLDIILLCTAIIAIGLLLDGIFYSSKDDENYEDDQP